MPAPLNILLITTDQHATHAIGCYGQTPCRTPAIDALARDAVRFTRAYTPCALCTPARGSILTGLYPHAHGAITNEGMHVPFRPTGEDGSLPFFSDCLREQHYRLAWHGKCHAGVIREPSEIGFTSTSPAGYDYQPNTENAYTAYLREHGLTPPRYVSRFDAQPTLRLGNGWGHDDAPLEATKTYFVAQKTIESLEENIEQYRAHNTPFFLRCDFWGPHAPYQPTRKYLDQYDPAAIPEWPSFSDTLEGKPAVQRRWRDTVFPGAAAAPWSVWAEGVAAYYAYTTMIDAQIERILNVLKRENLYNDTLVIFTSDHGDTAGVHGGMFDKGPVMYEEVYHIPLIVKYPGVAPGQVRDQFVSLVDLAPTFCAAAGVTMPRSHGGDLTPLLRDARAPWREVGYAQFHGHRMLVSQRMLRWGEWKYIFNPFDQDELYHLGDDPAERRNLADARPAVIAEARERLRAEMLSLDDTMGPEALEMLKNG